MTPLSIKREASNERIRRKQYAAVYWAGAAGVAEGGGVTLFKIDPQPPKGIKYMLGNEQWLTPAQRTPLRLVCEEWGNLGPLELNPEIQDNGHGFRVRLTIFPAPSDAIGFAQDSEGFYCWNIQK